MNSPEIDTSKYLPETTPNGERILSMSPRYHPKPDTFADSLSQLQRTEAGKQIVYRDPATHQEIMRTTADDNEVIPEDINQWSFPQLIELTDAYTNQLDADNAFFRATKKHKLPPERIQELENQITQLRQATDNLSQIEDSKDLLQLAENMAKAEIDYLITNGGRELSDYDDQFREEKDAILSADLFTDPRLEGSLQWFYGYTRAKLEKKRQGEIKSAKEGKIPPKPATPPPPAVAAATAETEATPEIRKLSHILDEQEQLEAQSRALELTGQDPDGSKKQKIEEDLKKLDDEAEAILEQIEGARNVLSSLDILAEEELQMYIEGLKQGQQIEDPFFSRKKDTLLKHNGIVDPRLADSLQRYYERKLLSLKVAKEADIIKAREERAKNQRLEGLTLNKHDKSITSNPRYLEELVEAMEDNSLDSKIIQEVANRMEEVSKMATNARPPGYESLPAGTIEGFLDRVWLAEARMHLYEAQKAVAYGDALNLDTWSKEMRVLLGTGGTSKIAFYMRHLLGEDTEKDEHTKKEKYIRKDRIEFFNDVVDYIKDASLEDKSDPTITLIRNFYQFGNTPAERQYASKLLLEDITAKNPQFLTKVIDKIKSGEIEVDIERRDKLSPQELQQAIEIKAKEILDQQLTVAIKVADSLYRVTLLAAEMNPPLRQVFDNDPIFAQNPNYRNDLAARAKRLPRLISNSRNTDPKFEAVPKKDKNGNDLPVNYGDPNSYQYMAVTGSYWDDLFSTRFQTSYGVIDNLSYFEYEAGKNITSGSGNSKIKGFLYAPVDFRARGYGVKELQNLANLRLNGFLSFFNEVGKRPDGSKIAINNFTDLLEAFQTTTPNSDVNSGRINIWIDSINDAPDKLKKFYENKDKGIVAEPISLENRLDLLKAYHDIEVSRHGGEHNKQKELQMWREFEMKMRKVCDPLIACIDSYKNLAYMNLIYLLYIKDQYIRFMTSEEAQNVTGYRFMSINYDYVNKIFFTHPKIRRAEIREVDRSKPEVQNLLAYIESMAQKYENYTAAQNVTANDIALFLNFGLQAITLPFGGTPKQGKK